MATPKLKVFRTAIGFHDAYVAAPSRKAALAAWGSSKDLFARGAAEVVTDPEFAAEPLASPGTVVKRLRGSTEEQLAALPPDRPKRRKDAGDDRPTRPPSRRTHKPRPRPSRSALDAAEEAIADAEAQHAAAIDDLRRREQALAEERRTLEEAQRQRLSELTAERDRADEAYRVALAEWASPA